MNNDIESIDSNEINDENFKLNSLAQDHLKTSAIWARFLAIVGFVFIGLMVIFVLFFLEEYMRMVNPRDRMPGAAMSLITIVYLIGAVISFFPPFFLIRFANYSLKALKSGDQNEIVSAFANLKNLNLYVGVITIIILAFYAIGILGLIAAS